MNLISDQDCIISLKEEDKEKYQDAPERKLDINWSIVPEELRPDYRKRMANKRKFKSNKVISVSIDSS